MRLCDLLNILRYEARWPIAVLLVRNCLLLALLPVQLRSVFPDVVSGPVIVGVSLSLDSFVIGGPNMNHGLEHVDE